MDAMLKMTKKPEEGNGKSSYTGPESPRVSFANKVEENDQTRPRESNEGDIALEEKVAEPPISNARISNGDKGLPSDKPDDAAKPDLGNADPVPIFKKRSSKPFKSK